jgi:hypothetical protein
MNNMGPMHFYTGIPDSKVATLPSYPRKGKVSASKLQKSEGPIKRFLWGGCTAEIKYDNDGHGKD